METAAAGRAAGSAGRAAAGECGSGGSFYRAESGENVRQGGRALCD